MSATINISSAALEIASYAMAVNDVRFYLNGMMIERSEHGGVRVCATNGAHLIACRDESGSIKQRKVQQYILPRELVTALVKSSKKGGRVEVRISRDGGIAARTGDVTHHSKLVPGKFPDWEAVIPTDDGMHGPCEANPELVRNVTSAYKSLCKHTGLSHFKAGIIWETRGAEEPVMCRFAYSAIHCIAVLMPMRGNKIHSFKEVKI